MGHRNVMDAVDFAMMQTQQHPSKGFANRATPSRSDRLHNKEALLYNNKKRNNVTREVNIHDTRKPDEADWGVMPARRGQLVVTPTTPTASNISSTGVGRSTNLKSPKRSPVQMAPPVKTRSSDALSKIASPSERLRSFEKRNTVSTTTRVNAADRVPSIEKRQQGNMTLAEKSIRQHVKAQNVKANQNMVKPLHEQEENPFLDVTRKHHNEDSTALFQSWRKSPKREHSA